MPKAKTTVKRTEPVPEDKITKALEGAEYHLVTLKTIAAQQGQSWYEARAAAALESLRAGQRQYGEYVALLDKATERIDGKLDRIGEMIRFMLRHREDKPKRTRNPKKEKA